MLRKESREVGGRMGPGSGVRHMMQGFLDQFGYKAQAKIAEKMADFIETHPDKAGNLPSLFKEFSSQVKEMGSEFPDAFN